MLRSWLKKSLYNKVLFGVLLVLLYELIFFGVLNLFLTKFPYFFFPEPEACVLCDGEPEEVPCLLNRTTGEVGHLAGTALPGKFQFVGCEGAMGGWDSDVRCADVSVPATAYGLNPFPFCRSCRWDLDWQTHDTYTIADLSDPTHPVFYPLEEGVYSILGYEVTVTQEGEEISLLVCAEE